MADFGEILDAARAGDDAARDQLLRAHLPGLRAFVRVHSDERLRAKESTSDLVQSVCREVLLDLSGFRERDPAAFRHWLFTVAQNKIVSRARYFGAACRDSGREQPVEHVEAAARQVLEAFGSLAATPSRHASAREELSRVERAFGELTPDHRQVITLVRVVGLPHAEAAKALGRSEAATRQLLARALAQLALRLVGRSAESAP
ncbi:MAG: RNA polymerase sigma factor [Planctomycetota bacterium]